MPKNPGSLFYSSPPAIASILLYALWLGAAECSKLRVRHVPIPVNKNCLLRLPRTTTETEHNHHVAAIWGRLRREGVKKKLK